MVLLNLFSMVYLSHCIRKRGVVFITKRRQHTRHIMLPVLMGDKSPPQSPLAKSGGTKERIARVASSSDKYMGYIRSNLLTFSTAQDISSCTSGWEVWREADSNTANAPPVTRANNPSAIIPSNTVTPALLVSNRFIGLLPFTFAHAGVAIHAPPIPAMSAGSRSANRLY